MKLEAANETPAVVKPTPEKQIATWSTTLSSGRVVTVREMTGRDLIYMEKELGKLGDVEKGIRIIDRLSVGDHKITYDEVLDLGVRDFKKISEIVGEASGANEDEDPN